ncbi:MAG: polysaccharide deacetylase family protein [Hespellia sp.]|nr:polysaccharide deacetylase family protein [Hespellia sp.]
MREDGTDVSSRTKETVQKTAQHRTVHSRHNRREAIKKKLIGIAVLCLFAILFFSTAASAGTKKSARIVVKADELTMVQEESVPKLTATASCSKNESVVLDEKSGYTAKDLLNDLNAGDGYTLTCDTDGKTEGTFPIVIDLSEDTEHSMMNEWFGKVTINVEDSNLIVKNKYGTWDGSKFKRMDGTYVVNDFIQSKGKTYYFDADNKIVTGWQDINGSKYLFDDKGVMETGWVKDGDGNKHYMNADGTMATNWVEIDGDKYCFDKDGMMYTGEQQVGVKKCVFAEDGKLESEEYRIDPTKPMIAITFDDGPGEYTMQLLDVLKQYDAHATFFMQGQYVANYTDEVKKMLEIGCELGNHSMDHTSLNTLGPDGVQQQITGTNSELKNACGQPATVMRPPYGAINDTVRENVGMPMILWSVDTLDWKTKDKDATVQSILTATDGDIVLLHDIHEWSVQAAIEAIPQLINNGYQLVTVSELAELKGYTMENGGTYSDFYGADSGTSDTGVSE